MRPCLNHAVLDFMESVLTPESAVLEFGAGYSTHWFARRARSVVTLEPDPHWAEVALARRVEVILTDSVLHAPRSPVDLVLVDGLNRVLACLEGWRRLRVGGWLILDDSERSEYDAAHRALDVAAADRRALLFDPSRDLAVASHREATAWQR